MANRHSTILMLVLVAVLLLSACTAAAPHADQNVPSSERRIDATALATLRERARAEGQIPLIVGFAVAGLETVPDDQARAAAITRERKALLRRLNGQTISNLKTYEFLPFIALTVDAVLIR
mgnify:CR=1 FL=1